MPDFRKYEALGNDYLVLDPATTDLEVSPEVARLLCDRHHGIGADGVLYGPLDSPDGAVRLRAYNSDGSECQKSGNGLRIFGRYLHERGYVTEPRFVVEAVGGPVEIEILDLRTGIVRAAMGRYELDSDRIPIGGPPRAAVLAETLTANGREFEISCVNVGTPHCVVTSVSDPTPDLVSELGPLIGRHPVFPERANVTFLTVRGRDRVAIEIWERGAGYTTASGACSCAAAIVARHLGLVDETVTVTMPGGVLTVELGADRTVALAGETRAVAEGHLLPDLRNRLRRPTADRTTA